MHAVSERENQLAVSESGPQQSPVEQPRPRNRSAKWGLEDNTLCYGQEKKLWVNIAICLSLSLSPSVSHTLQKLQPLSRIKCETYIFL